MNTLPASSSPALLSHRVPIEAPTPPASPCAKAAVGRSCSKVPDDIRRCSNPWRSPLLAAIHESARHTHSFTCVPNTLMRIRSGLGSSLWLMPKQPLKYSSTEICFDGNIVSSVNHMLLIRSKANTDCPWWGFNGSATRYQRCSQVLRKYGMMVRCFFDCLLYDQ